MRIDRDRAPEIRHSEIHLYLTGDEPPSWAQAYNRMANDRNVAARAAGEVGPPSIRIPISAPTPGSADQVEELMRPAIELLHRVNVEWREHQETLATADRALSAWWDKNKHQL